MSSNDGYNRNEDPNNGISTSDDIGSSRMPSSSTRLQPQIVPNEATHLKGQSKQAYFSDEKVLIPETETASFEICYFQFHYEMLINFFLFAFL